MMAMQLSNAAQVLGAEVIGQDVPFAGISTDTRTLDTGNLFVALQGPNFDGERFLEQAREKGAAAAAVSAASTADLPLLRVEDTRVALGRLAAHWRGRFHIPLVGITGSNGKTTVKEMTAAILERKGPTLVTRGNLNNDIGVPLTLFRLDTRHRNAVVEMGANHLGEIACLTDIVKPTVGLVNNAGPAHLEGFGSLTGVAKGKGELFAGLSEDAIAVINADDRFAPLWRDLAAQRQIVSFGLEARGVEFGASWRGDSLGSVVELHTPDGSVELRLQLPGRHNVMNALAATAAAVSAGANLDQVHDGLASLQPVGGRLQRHELSDGGVVLDDTYNANPASLRAGVEVLSLAEGPKWLVLGDMGELGETGQQLHRQVGKQARELGVNRLFALGELACESAEVFGDGGHCFNTMDELVKAMAADWAGGTTVLVKGSRLMQMERAVEALREQPGGSH